MIYVSFSKQFQIKGMANDDPFFGTLLKLIALCMLQRVDYVTQCTEGNQKGETFFFDTFSLFIRYNHSV